MFLRTLCLSLLPAIAVGVVHSGLAATRIDAGSAGDLPADAARNAVDTSSRLGLPDTIDVDLKGRGQETRVSYRFASALDGRHVQFRIRVRVPTSWIFDSPSSIQIAARDTRNRLQITDWSKGQLDLRNAAVVSEGRSYVLDIVYRPTPMTYAMEGYAPIGFNPDRSSGGGIQEVILTFATSGNAPPDTRMRGTAEILDQKIEAVEGDIRPEPAIITPLLRLTRNSASFVQPITTRQLGSGASGFFHYGFIGPTYDQAKVDACFAALAKSQHRYFRIMPTFHIPEGFKVGTAEFAAMDKLIESARVHQITLILTLFDAAVENPKLREIIQSDAERQKALESLRLFVERYRSEIQGGRVIISPVNEIYGFERVTERQKQTLVEEIDRLVIEKAPGATLIVGDVAHVEELAYHLHIPALFKNSPAKFIVATHVWRPDNFLPDADRLNLPDSGNIIGVWVTEHGAKDGYSWVASVAQKGYQVALVWTDSDYPYDPVLHRAALGMPMAGR